MTVMEKAEKANKVKSAMEKVKSSTVKPKDTVYTSMQVGEYHRQGDIYIERIEKDSLKLEPTKAVAQLAPGISRGSRHVVENIDSVEMYTISGGQRDLLQGPVINSKTPLKIVHPDHGNVTLPAGWYSVTYQQDINKQRVAD